MYELVGGTLPFLPGPICLKGTKPRIGAVTRSFFEFARPASPFAATIGIRAESFGLHPSPRPWRRTRG